MPAAFSLRPTWVKPEEPQFNTIITQSDNQKKNFLNISGSTPICQYNLMFDGLSDSDYYLMRKHYYSAASGGANVFAWTSVPDYIDTNFDGVADGNDMNGRWIEGSFKASPESNYWQIEIKFEQQVI